MSSELLQTAAVPAASMGNGLCESYVTQW